ncbi:MAG: pitrilysin family protein [Bacteroidota bacterium]
MIKFEKFTLDNGLRVIVQHDKSTPIAVVNMLYNVGARDEHSDKTGFAHLFEHLMFGGSLNIPSFDGELQKTGGNNNAFTNNDITNYYITLPKENIETAFWLESDRMLSLAFSKKSLDVQRNVVIEEFKQRYLNQPYGDVWLLLRPLAYKKHPYQWATIGKEISHIENATLEDVKKFFYNHYAPNNSIMTIVGNVKTDEIKKLSKKWFGDIEKREIKKRKLPAEPVQKEERKLSVIRDVPFNSIYKAYHMCARNDPDYYSADLISDILSNGKSSRLYSRLVKDQKIFSEIDAYIMGSIDDGLLIIEGTLSDKIKMEDADLAIINEIEILCAENISDNELNKIKNKIESTFMLSQMSPLNIAMRLSYHELIGKAEEINDEITKYSDVTADNIKKTANKIFRAENCCTLFYYAK